MLSKQNPAGAGGADRSSAGSDARQPHTSTTTPKPQFSQPTSTPKPVYSGGRLVGTVTGDVFRKNVSASRHFLRRPPAIGFSVESLVHAQQVGAVRVDVLDSESGCHYRATLAHIWAHGFELQRGGFERQLALPLSRWTRQEAGSPAQLALWQEGV